VPYQWPTAPSQYSLTPLALVSLFFRGHLVMNFHPCSSLRYPYLLRRKVYMRFQEMNLLMTCVSRDIVGSDKFCLKWLVIFRNLVFEEICDCFPICCCNFSQTFIVCALWNDFSSISGLTNISPFILASLIPQNLGFNREPLVTLAHFLKRILLHHVAAARQLLDCELLCFYMVVAEDSVLLWLEAASVDDQITSVLRLRGVLTFKDW
jgi:hypothetical protein